MVQWPKVAIQTSYRLDATERKSSEHDISIKGCNEHGGEEKEDAGALGT